MSKNEPRRSSRVIHPPDRLSSDYSTTQNTEKPKTGRKKKADKRRLSKSEVEKPEITKKTKRTRGGPTPEWYDRKVKTTREFAPNFGNSVSDEQEIKEEMEKIKEVMDEILKEKEEILREESQDIADAIGEPKVHIPLNQSTEPKTEIKGKDGRAAFPLIGLPKRKKMIYQKVTQRKMDFFEPITKVVAGHDEKQLSHVPVIHEHTDDMAVCSQIYKIYQNGIHGYVPDASEMSPQLLFQLFKKLLPTITNPDLFYYAMHRSYPNFGSQDDMSERFPKLVRKFVRDKQEIKNLLELEPWKPKKEESEGDDDEEDEDDGTMDSDFTGNHVIKLIEIYNGTDRCSEDCYKMLEGARLNEKLGKFLTEDNYVEVYIMKSCKAEEAQFINEMMRKNKKRRKISNFCETSRKFPEISCAEWFGRVMRVCRQPVDGIFQDEIMHDFKTRDGRFRKQMIAEETARKRRKAEEDDSEGPLDDVDSCTIAPITPCDHFGPCGPEFDYCSCKGICSIDCKCNINCKRKFPGCRCTKMCLKGSCPCRKSGWECNVKTCKSCVDLDTDDLIPCCKNTDITRNQGKLVLVKTSEIPNAGNGAFMGEDVAKDEYIGEYVGERISEEETERRGKFYELSTSYLFSLPGLNGSIDATRAGNQLRFVNHSKTPNCRIEYRMVDNEVRIGFFTNVAIRTGKELTFDYRYDNGHAQRFFNLKPVDRVPKFACYERELNNKVKYKKFNVEKLVKQIEEESKKEQTVTRSGRLSKNRRYDSDVSTSSSHLSFDPTQPSTSAAAAAAAAAQHPIILSDDEEEDDDM
ncbi:hypothetical protein CRE_14930 [Caenorhabditis remanei]|uniref:Uncharacterized protein n=1 Tax=Caenorhabditis remanei TaxID=31234 RepID=E3N7R3_CAERE|nr:hypothetical protein CRE_14930 [Caenorhabditis remanei]